MGAIIICAAVFLMQNLSPHLALWPLYSGYFQPWQLFTYAFLHGSFNHLFFNMFAVFMFGFPLEKMWGSKRYAEYYGICLLGAGLIQLVVQYISGEMCTPLLAPPVQCLGCCWPMRVMWPNNKLILLFFPVPIKAKWFVLIYGAVELIFGVYRCNAAGGPLCPPGRFDFRSRVIVAMGLAPQHDLEKIGPIRQIRRIIMSKTLPCCTRCGAAYPR